MLRRPYPLSLRVVAPVFGLLVLLPFYLVIAVSTLFTKQHYVADIIAGIALAGVADAVFLRRCPHEPMAELDRRGAPVLVAGLVAIYGLIIAGGWIAYTVGRTS